MNIIKNKIENSTRATRYSFMEYSGFVPYNVIHKYVGNYTNEGETVLDPFCGLGKTGFEAVNLNRKFVGLDINPVAIFAAHTLADDKYNLDVARNTLDKILEKIQSIIDYMYTTKCEICSDDSEVVSVIYGKVDDDNYHPKKLKYFCEKCKGKVKDMSEEDVERAVEINSLEIKYWYPKTQLNNPVYRTVDQLFTKRTLISLSILNYAIDLYYKQEHRNLYKLALAAHLLNCSKMHDNENYFDLNVFDFYKIKFNTMLMVKKELQSLMNGDFTVDKFNVLNRSIVTSKLQANNTDYIFTEMPTDYSVFRDPINCAQMAWLNMKPPTNDEIFYDKENPMKYKIFMKKAFTNLYTSLKPGKFMTVAFSNTDEKYVKASVEHIREIGFKEVAKVLQDKRNFDSFDKYKNFNLTEEYLLYTFRK